MEGIYIFDLDGCVMPPIFSNFVDPHKSRHKLVNYVERNGYKITLFSSFLKFYEQYCKSAQSVVFITGRKKSEFGKLTESQLKPLIDFKPYEVIYYPEEKENRAQDYFDWKVGQINEILKHWKEDEVSYKNPNKILKAKIYDDLIEYFPRIKKIAKNLNLKLELFKIKGEKSWHPLLKSS
jgi:hypothetical protein